MSATPLTQTATNIDDRTIDDDRVIDFDIAANTDYEIQSCVIVNDDNHVVEAAVRFGRIQERPDLGIGKPILSTAWTNMVADHTNADAVDADLSDFQHIVPHLRIERENVEEYGLDTLTLTEFSAAVADLADLVETVLRGSDTEIDREIDAYL